MVSTLRSRSLPIHFALRLTARRSFLRQVDGAPLVSIANRITDRHRADNVRAWAARRNNVTRLA